MLFYVQAAKQSPEAKAISILISVNYRLTMHAYHIINSVRKTTASANRNKKIEWA